MKVIKTTLTLEERDLLNDSLDSDLFNVYTKLLNELVSEMEQLVLKQHLTDLSDTTLQQLALAKAQAQGARQLLFKFAALKGNNNKQIKR